MRRSFTTSARARARAHPAQRRAMTCRERTQVNLVPSNSYRLGPLAVKFTTRVLEVESPEMTKATAHRLFTGRWPSYQRMSGDVLLSHTVARAVPSALRGLASGFGMGPGVSLSL